MHRNRVYLIEDLFGAPAVCASRSCDRLIGEPLSALGVSELDVAFLRNALLDFTLSPILLLAGDRPAVLLGSYWRSSDLFELITLDASPSALLALVGAFCREPLIAPSFTDVLPKKRVTPAERATVLEVCRRTELLSELCAQLPECDGLREAILYERFLRTSAEFLGVGIELCGELPQGSVTNCDRALAAAFLTLSLLTVRDGAPTRMGCYAFSVDRDRLTVSFDAELSPDDPSLTTLRRLFTNVSYDRRNGRAYVELCCCVDEISLLGIKADP